VSERYRAGSVWLLNVDFGRGNGKQEKFIVLLSDCLDTRSLFAFATSQPRYPTLGASPCGCPSASCYRIDPGQESCWSKTTYIQFDNAHPITRGGLDDFVNAGNAQYMKAIDTGRFRSILNCAKKSTDLPTWATDLVDRTLQAITLASTRKPVPKTASPSSTAFVSAEFTAVWKRYQASCDACRTSAYVLAEIAEADFSLILRGEKRAPENFAMDAQAAFEIANGECPGCQGK